MAKRLLMTWVSAQKRWTKKYRGTTHSVSCRQLGTAPTKEASTTAANEWWERRRAEIDARNAPVVIPPDPANRVLQEVFANRSVHELRAMVERGQAAELLLQVLDGASTFGHEAEGTVEVVPEVVLEDGTVIPAGEVACGPAPDTKAVLESVKQGELVPLPVIDRILAPWKTGPLSEGGRTAIVERLTGKLGRTEPVESSRQIGPQVDSWLRVLRSKVAAGGIDVGRYDAYRANLNLFRNWADAHDAQTGLPNCPSLDAISAVVLEQYHSHLLERVGERKRDGKPHGMSADYAKSVWATVKMFVERLTDHGLIVRPGNLRKLRITAPPKAVPTFATAEVRTLVGGCDGFSERTKLYLLLMVNCGLYQSDISDLTDDEVDWTKGTITRRRSKTRRNDPNGPTVTWKLWPETFELLTKNRNTDDGIQDEYGRVRVLVTAAGGPLVPTGLKDNGNATRTDNVKSAYRRLCDRLGVPVKPLKYLRKTSATLLQGHKEYKFYAQFFLGHSPRTVADKHYVVPSQTEFDAAVDWLRRQYLAGGVVPQRAE